MRNCSSLPVGTICQKLVGKPSMRCPSDGMFRNSTLSALQHGIRLQFGIERVQFPRIGSSPLNSLTPN